MDDGLADYGSDVEKYSSLDMVKIIISPKGEYPEVEIFRKNFQIGATMYYNSRQ